MIINIVFYVNNLRYLLSSHTIVLKIIAYAIMLLAYNVSMVMFWKYFVTILNLSQHKQVNFRTYNLANSYS